jgi:hypothetical protein
LTCAALRLSKRLALRKRQVSVYAVLAGLATMPFSATTLSRHTLLDVPLCRRQVDLLSGSLLTFPPVHIQLVHAHLHRHQILT